MEVNELFSKLDSLFNDGNIEGAGLFLEEQYEAACSEGNQQLALVILNEQIGYYRVTTQYEKALKTIDNVEDIIKKLKLAESIEEGTSLLNAATVLRAMGDMDRSLEYYLKAEKIYDRQLDKNDYRMAGLYNNISLMYAEKKEYSKSIEYLRRAIPIIAATEGAAIQLAVTHVNLGQVYCRMEEWEEARKELETAEEIFERTDINDEHYSGCANALGYMYLKQEKYDAAVKYYEKALANIKSSYGETENYRRLQDDLEEIKRLASK